MGRTPPVGLPNASSPAPAMYGATARGAAPLASSWATAVSCCTTVPRSAGDSASRKCWARMPEGPAPEPSGKDRSALSTVLSLRLGAGGSTPEGLEAQGAPCGWSCRSAARTSGVVSRRGPETKAAHALLSYPSLVKASALCLRSVGDSFAAGRLPSSGRCAHRAACSPASHRLRRSTVKEAAAFPCLRPPRLG